MRLGMQAARSPTERAYVPLMVFGILFAVINVLMHYAHGFTISTSKTSGERIAMPYTYYHGRMTHMIAVSQYKVAQLPPNDRRSLDQVQRLLDEHAREGWDLVTALQFEGAVEPPVDQMIQSLSNTTSTLFIFKRPA